MREIFFTFNSPVGSPRGVVTHDNLLYEKCDTVLTDDVCKSFSETWLMKYIKSVLLRFYYIWSS